MAAPAREGVARPGLHVERLTVDIGLELIALVRLVDFARIDVNGRAASRQASHAGLPCSLAEK